MKRYQKFIVIEGGDGSGKATQTRWLKRRLQRSGKRVHTIAFPRHGTKDAALVDWYLNGWICEKAQKADPRLVQAYYFYDQWLAQKKIKRWLAAGDYVIADRYCTSGKGHQLGKLDTSFERKKFLEWSNNLTYQALNFALAGRVIYLDTSLSSAAQHKDEQRTRQGVKLKDLHERDGKHLQRAAAGYHWAAGHDKYDRWKIIDCMDRRGKMKPIAIIHQEVWGRLKLS